MKTVEDEISFTLEGVISPSTRRSLFNRLGGLASTPIHQLSRTDRRLILLEMEASIRLFAPEESSRVLGHCTRILDQPAPDARAGSPRRIPSAPSPPIPPSPPRFVVSQGEDVSRIRLETWSEATRLGFGKAMAIQIATTAAELARRIVGLAGRGTIELLSEQGPRGGSVLEVVAQNDQPGAGAGGADGLAAEGALKAIRPLAGDLRIDPRPGGLAVVCRFQTEDGPFAEEPMAAEPLAG